MFNSRSASLLLSLIISVVTCVFLSLSDAVDAKILVLIFILIFSISFLTVFLSLEFLVFRDLRKLYRLFNKISGRKVEMNKNNLSVRQIGKKLFVYANMKQKEVDKLKKLETFRREFLADISHELKTPVFAAQGFIHTLLDGAIDDKSVRKKFLKKAGKSLDSLNALVQDLITISQMETGEIRMQKEAFDFEFLVSEVFDQLENKAAKRDIELIITNKTADTTVMADYYRISQVVTNLVDNAIKYGGSPGTIEIIIEEKEEKLLIVIKDDGPGIPAEHHSRIFQRFYRIDKSRSREKGGTGLGLSIVKHIVEAHDSDITLYSEPDKGCQFKFKLDKVMLHEEA